MAIRRFTTLLIILLATCLHVNAAEQSLKIPKVTSANALATQVAAKDAGKAKEAKRSPEVVQLIKDAEKIKQELITLNRDLYAFEEELLYPTETQLAVFLSLNSESTFTLDSIELLLDDKLVATYLYKETELEALKKGGVQRIYLGSLSDGRHKLTAQFNGQGENNSYFRRKKALKFSKENKAKYIQMEVSESSSTREPLFKVKQW